MNRFKHAALTLAVTGLLSMQAHAAEVRQENMQTLPVAAFSQADIDAMFVQSDQPMQLAVLSQQEMKETEGALFNPWGAAIGGMAGGGSYFLNNRISGAPWSWSGFGSAAAGGAVTGSGLGAVRLIWTANQAIAGGTALGVAQHYGW